MITINIYRLINVSGEFEGATPWFTDIDTMNTWCADQPNIDYTTDDWLSEQDTLITN